MSIRSNGGGENQVEPVVGKRQVCDVVDSELDVGDAALLCEPYGRIDHARLDIDSCGMIRFNSLRQTQREGARTAPAVQDVHPRLQTTLEVGSDLPELPACVVLLNLPSVIGEGRSASVDWVAVAAQCHMRLLSVSMSGTYAQKESRRVVLRKHAFRGRGEKSRWVGPLAPKPQSNRKHDFIALSFLRQSHDHYSKIEHKMFDSRNANKRTSILGIHLVAEYPWLLSVTPEPKPLLSYTALNGRVMRGEVRST
jgi:hypothetical protein